MLNGSDKGSARSDTNREAVLADLEEICEAWATAETGLWPSLGHTTIETRLLNLPSWPVRLNLVALDEQIERAKHGHSGLILSGEANRRRQDQS